MESTRDALLGAERAAAAPFINYPATPWWHPLFMAVILTTMATGSVLTSEFDRSWLGTLLALGALVVAGIYMAFYRRRWGTWPRMAAAPAEIKAAYRWYLVAVVLAVAVIALAWFAIGWPVGLAAVFLCSLVLYSCYEGVIYPRAAAEVRKRLA